MADLVKIDSNVTGLRYAEEASLGVLPAAPVWIPLEPNSYADFGGELKTVARNPINPSRQRKKGVAVDLDASGGINNDLTQSNLQDQLQGFMFASARRKAETIINAVPVTDVEESTDDFTLANLQATVAVVAVGGTGYAIGDTITLTGGTSTTATVLTVLTLSVTAVATVSITTPGRYSVAPGNPVAQGSSSGGGTGATFTMTFGPVVTLAAGMMVKGAGFAVAANNGVKVINGVTTPNTVFSVAESLADETPATTAGFTVIGQQGAADDLDVDASGALPQITSTVLDFTTLGIIPGEWIFVGGDTAATRFTTAANNGFKRVKLVTANAITIDKSAAAMVTEVSAGSKTVQLFLGRVLKNESDPTLIRRRSYNLERTLGAPDDSAPAAIQSEYLEGAVGNEFTINVPTAEKVTVDLSWVAINSATRTAAEGVKAGTRPALVESEAFNTSSDFTRIKMALVSDTDEAPVPLFAFLTDLTISINNNVTPNKAVGVFGAFEVTAGTFAVGGELTAYFANVTAVESVRSNSDITLDIIIAKANAGIAIDLPLLSLGDGRPNVEQDQPITLPLSNEAATGAKVDPNMDHTLLMVFWDYLPTAAE